jgi:diguanylate cyclase (GGDEF)-like protein/PAS domain S-box-containing protein
MDSYAAYLESLFTALSELGVFQKSYGSIASFTNSLWQQWGYTDEEFLAGQWYEYVHPDDRERILRSHNELLGGSREVFQEEYRFRTKDGEYRSLWSIGRYITWDPKSAKPGAYLGLDIDISLLKEQEEELRRAQSDAEERVRKAEMLQQAAKIVTASLDMGELAHLILDELAKVCTFSGGRVYRLHDGRLQSLEGADLYRDHLKSVDRPVYADDEEMNLFDRGEAVWTPGRIAVPLSFRGDRLGLLTLYSHADRSFSEKEAQSVFALSDFISIALANAGLYGETRRLAMEDSLTGLPTRRLFMSHGQKMLAHALRYGSCVTLLMLDIDNFKSYNDNNGHLAGDAALRRVADVCLATIRRADLSCRYGGEEIAILLFEADIKSAKEVAERLRKAVAEAEVASDLPGVSVSIGLAGFSPDKNKVPMGLDALIRDADVRLYRAKMEGKNRVVG